MRRFLRDDQALAFVQGQAYRINQTVYETIYPEWAFEQLLYVNTEGPEWAPGVLTYTSSMTGRAEWQSPNAKDVPLADVGTNGVLRGHHLAAIGYQYNVEEVNTAIQVGGSLPDRRARAARLAYREFMWNVTLFGRGYAGGASKGIGGLANYSGIVPIAAAANGDAAPATAWVLNSGVGNKTPAEIVADINAALSAVAAGTQRRVLADTLLLPPAAYDYLASTPYSTMLPYTILEWLVGSGGMPGHNLYTQETGRPLRVRAVPDLATAATTTIVGGGRMVAYSSRPEYAQLLLPMPHRFLPVYQDGPLNWTVPGIFRTGGVEVSDTAAVRYVDGITPIPT